MLNEKFVTPPCNGVGLTPSFVWGFSLWESLEWSGIVSPWEWGPGGLTACGMWCFMLNSSPGPQIVFHSKIKCMVPLKWQVEEFFPSVAAAFLCVALGCLKETSEPGVRWSQGSSLNFELKLRHSASEKYLA